MTKLKWPFWKIRGRTADGGAKVTYCPPLTPADLVDPDADGEYRLSDITGKTYEDEDGKPIDPTFTVRGGETVDD